MNTKGFLGVGVFLLVFVAAGVIWGQYEGYNRPVPLMDYVPQEIGIYDTTYDELAEQDCRGCHGNSLADRHHATSIVVDYGLCTPCHAVIPESPGVAVIRDCLTSGCHSSADLGVNGWHHDTDLSASGNCVACHDPNLIARISPVQDFNSYPPSVVTPSPFSCENCHWGQGLSTTQNPDNPGHPSTYDHYGSGGEFIGAYEYTKPIYGSFDTHHMGFVGGVASACYRCHAFDPDDPSWSPNEPELIRYCEICHDIATLHTIAPHVEGSPGWVAAGFHVDSDLPADVDPALYRTSQPTGPYLPETTPGFAPDEMCMGCHGDTISERAPSGAAVPVIEIIQPTHGVCGAIVGLRGGNFGEEHRTDYHVQLEISSGSWVDLPVYSWTSTQVEFKVPCWEVGPGNYKVRVETPGGESNQVNFTVENVSVNGLIPEVGACGVWITLNGIGFGNSQFEMLDEYYGVHHVVDFVASQGGFTAVTYKDWTDTSLKVGFSAFFEDDTDPVTQERNFIQDSIGEPLIQGCGQLGVGLWSVYLKTVYFGDEDGSGALSSGDTVFQVVPCNPYYFELVRSPAINILNPDTIDNYNLLTVVGRNFGPSQRDGEVRIGLESQAQSATLGKGLLLSDVSQWSNTLIKVYVNVLHSEEAATWFVWMEKSGVKSNYESLEIRPGIPTYTLTVVIQGEGSVTKSPPCGSYEKGTVVELLATAAAGWDFSHWTDGVQQSVKNPLTLTMNTDKAVTAVFVEEPVVEHTLTVVIQGEGSVTPPGGSYEKGTVVELLAAAAAGWDFSHWTDGVQQSVKNPLTLTMNTDKAVTAVFVEEPVVGYTLTVVIQGEGSVTKSPPCGSYEKGTVVELLATAAAGWDFSHWTDGVQQSVKNPLTLTMNTDKAVKAVFVEEPVVEHTLTVVIQGEGSVTPPGGSYEKGTVVELLATAAAGWDFSHWTDGVQQSVKNPLTLTMNTDKAVKAVFVEEPVVGYTLTVVIQGEGSVTPPGGSYEKGTVVELLGEPASGWTFSYWNISGQSSRFNPLTLTMNTDKAVKAVFVEEPVVGYTLTVVIQGEGSVTPPGGSYEKGTVVELLATAAAGWDFSHWTDGVQQSVKNPLTLTMNTDKAVKAVFVEEPVVEHTLTVVIQGEGSVTPPGGSYEKGTVVELLAAAAAGWDFSHWTDGVQHSVKNPLTLTMNTDKAVKAVFTQDTLSGLPGGDESPASTPSDTRDGNNDGIIDSMQDNVASLKTSDGQHYVTIESVAGTVLSYCMAVDRPSEADGLPSEGEYPYGFFAFAVENVEIGGETTVTIYLPEDASPTAYYKYGPEPGNSEAHWYEFMYDDFTKTGAKIDGNKITLYFVDGERGDDDLEANGRIVDDGGPSSEEKKGAGCFISTMAL